MENLSGRQHEFLQKLFALTDDYQDANVTAIGQGAQDSEYVVVIHVYLREGSTAIWRKGDRVEDDSDKR